MTKEELIEMIEDNLRFLDKTCLNDFMERRSVNEVVYDLESTLRNVYKFLTGEYFECDED